MHKKGKKHNFKYALGGKAYGMKSADEGRKVAGVGLPGPGPTQTMEGTVYESVANPNEPLGKFSYRPKTKSFTYEGQTYAAGQSYNIPKLGEGVKFFTGKGTPGGKPFFTTGKPSASLQHNPGVTYSPESGQYMWNPSVAKSKAQQAGGMKNGGKMSSYHKGGIVQHD